jgi:hypothetical protein
MYILLTGAPGSKWSSVAESIYWSDSIDHTDNTQARGYKNGVVKHVGAYWDPGMEFENTDWDGPFSGNGKRIVKSHTFAHQLETLKSSGHPIVMVHRNDYECFKWWLEAGGFDITYPNYKYFENLDKMWQHIQAENKDIMQFVKDHSEQVTLVKNSMELCSLLEIDHPTYINYYKEKDVKVYVYKL